MMITGALDEKKDRKKFIVAVGVAVVALTAPGVTLARDVVVSGGVSVGYEFDDRQYEDDAEDPALQEEEQSATDTELTKKDNRDERYSRLRLSPLVTLTSSGDRDEVELHYSPTFSYDFENSDNNVDHNLKAALSRYITRDWQAKISDRYRLSDIIENRYGDSERTVESSDDETAPDTTTGTTTDTTTDDTARLSDTNNRRRYWTNDLALLSEYEYWKDSMFGVGYNYGILRNIDNDDNNIYEDYDRHEVFSGLGHRFDPVWKLSIFGSYVHGLFDSVDGNPVPLDEEDAVIVEDDDDEVKEYRATTVLQADFFEHHSHLLEYSFYTAEPDSDTADPDSAEKLDATIQNMALVWHWNYSENVVFVLGGGPTYTKIEDEDGEWGYNGRTSLSYAFERGYIAFSARRGFEVLNFTGTGDNGLREFWQSMLKLGYRLSENLSANLYTSYRYEDEETITEISPAITGEAGTTESETATEESVVTEKETFNRKRFSTGLSFGYSFWQWYKLSLSYDYSKQDSEAIDDSFDEHRVALVLSYEQELFKW